MKKNLLNNQAENNKRDIHFLANAVKELPVINDGFHEAKNNLAEALINLGEISERNYIFHDDMISKEQQLGNGVDEEEDNHLEETHEHSKDDWERLQHDYSDAIDLVAKETEFAKKQSLENETMTITVEIVDQSQEKKDYWAMGNGNWLFDEPIEIVRTGGWDIDVRPIGYSSRGVMIHKSIVQPVDKSVDYESWLDKASENVKEVLHGY